MSLFSIFFTFLFAFGNTPTTNIQLSNETYQVVFVQGNISIGGQALTRGASLNASQKVVFKGNDAKAVVISTTRGRFVLDSKKATPAGSELVAFIKDVVSPLKTNSKLSTRGGLNEKGILDLEKHFGMQAKPEEFLPTFIMIGDNYEFKIGEKVEANQIVAVKTGAKMTGLKRVGNMYAISKASVQDAKKVEIIYAKKGTTKQDVRASFKPLFIESKDLKDGFEQYLKLVDIEEIVNINMKKANDLEVAANKLSASDLDAKIKKMTTPQKKALVLFYYLQESFGEMDAQGNIDVNKIKVDEDYLEKFINDNKL